MTARCALSPDCTFGAHDPAEHPCGKRHIPGAPCGHCGKPTSLDGSPCPDCWTPIPENYADAKALLARGGISLGIPVTPSAEGSE